LWILLAWFPSVALRFAPVFLLIVTGGLCTAWLQAHPRVLDRLGRVAVPVLQRTAGHLDRSRRALDNVNLSGPAANLSGIAESIGILSAALLYAGPVAVTGLPPAVYYAGIVLVTVHVWSAWWQVMTFPSWYSPAASASSMLVRLRPLMPALLAVVAFALFAWRDYAGTSPPPGGWVFALLSAGSFLLLIPETALFEALLRSAARTFAVHLADTRESNAVTVHSRVKSAATVLVGQSRQDPFMADETRSLINAMLAVSEEARQSVLAGEVTSGSVELLWKAVSPILPRDQGPTMCLEPASYLVQLNMTDYDLARRVLLDLITNAWTAGADVIKVAVSSDLKPAGLPGSEADPAHATSRLPADQWITVQVDDDGAGIRPGALSDPLSSLRVLERHLGRYSGTVTLAFMALVGGHAGRGSFPCRQVHAPARLCRTPLSLI
jgi:hypothetical protein